MNTPQNQFDQSYTANSQSESIAKTFMTSVFSWMFLALGITAVTAYIFASSPSLIAQLYTDTGLSILGWVVMLAPFGLVMFMSARFRSLDLSKLSMFFLIYAVLMGMSLSFILLVYTQASVFSTFIVTSGTFGLMAIVGYTTNTDLTKFGSILFMALIGIILASVVNFFMNSGTLEYIISILGVLIFTGLTAYDVQKLKRIGMATGDYFGESKSKLAIMGALTLYLDFINLFLFLLRFLGNRK